MFLEVGQEAFIRQEKAMINRSESQSILSSITCPTLVIHAMQDKNFSLQEDQELVDQIQNAKLGLIEDSGHMSPIEMPQAVTALIRLWLTY
jgi:pimeloyl-ACP methyl ester carboxylesterase